MPMRKRGSLGRKTVKSKAVEHTRAAEAPDEKRARLQADQVHQSLARATETPEQYKVRIQSQQVRHNASRAAERSEKRQSRLHEDQVRHRVARAAETPEQRQSLLQIEDYGVLLEAVRNDNSVTSENLGKLVVLPSSFTGGPHYMPDYAQDGMAYVRHRGIPDVFITFPCNPSWPEITVELLPGQVAEDRVDLVARVFQQKAKKMMHVIKDVQLFEK
ncbi:hypothetical protein TNCT_109321 [Trichonephila clavata]|uniref:Helitron helicase-like domain-containing protein n=1 Tax=Trichonephila clavata TaxID=2740835 RepID=A0A8X6HIR7_TRICU|nr:hypothetical protein TNCT_109321 [Trichonephila clavata]